jgi:site-specific DNA-methyltransferase (adenine-specific)
MAATLDVWEIAPEGAKRVQHPAPFPVELPERLIRLYTYANDLVVDPFMGSGSALVAAARTGRRYAGYDLDPDYVATARRRVAAESASGDDPRTRGGTALAIAARTVEAAGFTIVGRNARLRGLGLTMSLVAADRKGVSWYFDVSGAFTTTPSGLAKTDAVWRSLGHAHVMAQQDRRPVVFLTSHLPRRGSDGDAALRAAGTEAFFDAIELLSGAGEERLRCYGVGDHHTAPIAGFWNDTEIARWRLPLT